MENNINEAVRSAAERIENADSTEDIDPLDATFRVSMDNTIQCIELQLTVGGPNIELILNGNGGTVRGNWGTEKQSIPLFKNEDLLNELYRQYKTQFNVANDY